MKTIEAMSIEGTIDGDCLRIEWKTADSGNWKTVTIFDSDMSSMSRDRVEKTIRDYIDCEDSATVDLVYV